MAITRELSAAILSILLCPGLLPAQSELVLPPSHEQTVGSGATNLPFGRSTPNRVQLAYDAMLFSSPVEIDGLAFRLQEGELASSKMVELEIRLSSLGKPVTWMQQDFDRNRGADEKLVFARQLLTLPELTEAASPNPFHFEISFDESFSYDPANGSLVIELIVHSQQPGAFPLDSTFICDSPREDFGPPGCGPQAGEPLKIETVTSQVTWGRPLVLRVFDAKEDAATAIIMGNQETGLWQGYELPFELGSLGAPSCFLALDMWRVFSISANAAGSAEYELFVPSDPSLQGSWLRFQGVALDSGANALGLVTSQGTKVEICGWEPVSRVFASGLIAAEGLREVGVAPVVRLNIR